MDVGTRVAAVDVGTRVAADDVGTRVAALDVGTGVAALDLALLELINFLGAPAYITCDKVARARYDSRVVS